MGDSRCSPERYDGPCRLGNSLDVVDDTSAPSHKVMTRTRRAGSLGGSVLIATLTVFPTSSAESLYSPK